MTEIERPAVCIVTGAGGALGRQVALDLAARGAQVVAVVRHPNDSLAAERLQREVVDLTDPKAVAGLVERTLERHGRVDALVNVAGGYRGGSPFGETSPDEWRAMRDANLETAIAGCRAVLPAMLARRHGRIVNVSSRAAKQPFAGAAPYIVAKAGVIALTEAIAAETHGTGVTANVVLPSVIDTSANRAAMPDADHTRWVTPADLARVIAWLIDEPTGLVNGAIVPAYGRG